MGTDEDWGKWDRRIRDTVMFSVGILGIINELFLMPEPRASALVFLASLVGLPFIIAKDEKERKSNGDK